MTAAAASASARPVSALRPPDPRRDLAQIADLMDLSFGGQLDDAGRQWVREMRWLGHAGWLGWILAHLVLPPMVFPRGFVWEEQGTVVGNVGIVPLEGHRWRWVLSNLAVHPDFQRRGIGTQLIQASLRRAEEGGAEEVILQVEDGLAGVKALYARQGFRTLCTRTTWFWRPHQERPTPSHIKLLRPNGVEQWQQQRALARRLHPEGLTWPYPFESRMFGDAKLGFGLGMSDDRHWQLWEGGQLIASLTARRRGAGEDWRLVLVAEPNARERVVGPLLAFGLNVLPHDAGAVVDFPVGPADGFIVRLGFHFHRTLSWMAASLPTGNAPTEAVSR